MKQYLLFMLCVVGMAFCGCDDDDEGTANLVGQWAVVATTDLVSGPIQNERIDQIVVVTNDTFTFYLAKDNASSDEYGYKFIDGYLYGCGMSDFEKQVSFNYHMSDGKLYVMSIEIPLKIENANRISIPTDITASDEFMILERLNGFK